MEIVDVDTLPIALVSLDERRRVVGANTEAEILLGQSRRALDGRALNEVLYHDLPLFDLIDRTMGRSELAATGLELRGPLVRAQKRDVLVVNRPGEGPILVISPTRRQSGHSESAAGLANFGRILGHEVKNPLAGISGAAQLLKRKARTDQVELVDMVLAESRRIERLIERLSAFELFSAPRLAPTNVHTVLDSVIRGEEIAFARRVVLEREYDPSLPDVYADSDHLHEVFQNLVRNACEAVLGVRDRPGRVSVISRYASGMKLASKQGAQTQVLCVTVRDNGVGVSPEDQAKMFDMFHTTKSTGSGLGLTVVSQIVAAHGGELVLQSQPEQTDFSVFLPIYKETKS